MNAKAAVCLKRWLATPLAISLLFAGYASVIQAQEPASGTGCESYDVDVTAELALFTGAEATRVTAGTGDNSSPALQPNKLYTLTLAPQTDVRFAAAPERRMLDDGAFAGLAAFSVKSAGTWRIGLGHNSWVDVVAADGEMVKSTRFGGRTGCASLRKFVEFPLQAGVEYTLQLSGGTEGSMAVVISGPVASAP